MLYTQARLCGWPVTCKATLSQLSQGGRFQISAVGLSLCVGLARNGYRKLSVCFHASTSSWIAPASDTTDNAIKPTTSWIQAKFELESPENQGIIAGAGRRTETSMGRRVIERPCIDSRSQQSLDYACPKLFSIRYQDVVVRAEDPAR